MQQDKLSPLPPLPWSRATAPTVIDALERSGLSVNRFTALHKVPPHRIFYWRKMLALQNPPSAARLLPIKLENDDRDPGQAPQFEGTIEVQMANGLIVCIRGAVHQSHLACVLQACGDFP